MNYNRIITFLISISALGHMCANIYPLSSPDGQIEMSINAADNLIIDVKYKGVNVLLLSNIGYETLSGKRIGDKISMIKRSSNRNVIKTPFYRKSEIADSYNELTAKCDKNTSIQFRAYNDGIAYRVIGHNTPIYDITSDMSEFVFPENTNARIPYINDNRGNDPYMFSFESYYDHQPLDQMYADSLAITPILMEMQSGIKTLLIDTDIEHFAGMFIKKGTKANSLKPTYAPYVLEGDFGGFNELNYIPKERAKYVARLQGTWELPWKGVVIADSDKGILMSDLMYKLSAPCELEDCSWIKPGKTTWEWWNNCNMTGVDFKRGINTDTYKYHIDFASDNGIEYILIDEGWSTPDSLMEINPEVDIEYLAQYAKEKGVGIILWASWKNLHNDIDKVFSHYSGLGIEGFKIDFFDSDDNRMVHDMYSIARKAADYHLVLDYHGMKANGMQRTFPNILSFEGVKGLENNRWVKHPDIPAYECTLPFIRMQAGPMDYTPGGMRNATLQNFAPNDTHPMVYGTRAHQIALYTIFESPLQILADSPSKYLQEKDSFSFIQKIPTIFEETLVLNAKIGEYIVIARRSGQIWYVAGITNWQERELNIDFSFLKEGKYAAQIFQDGINSDFEATDYKCFPEQLSYADTKNIRMMPGGGWNAIITPTD